MSDWPLFVAQHLPDTMSVADMRGWPSGFVGVILNGHGYVTIDFNRRCFRGGLVVSGSPDGHVPYQGRGWAQSLVADATAWLVEVYQ